jgi:hypothetical protein
MFSGKKNTKSNQQRESRDVTLGDIETISSGMTECIKKRSSGDKITQRESYDSDDGYGYSNAVTQHLPPLLTPSAHGMVEVSKLCYGNEDEEQTLLSSSSDRATRDLENPERHRDAGGLQKKPTGTRKTVKELMLDIKDEGEEEVTPTSGSSRGRTPRKKREKKYRQYAQETSDNHDRPELLWTRKIEDVIYGWHNKCLKYADWHAMRAKHHKKIFYGLGIPSAIIPMALAAGSELMGADWKVLIIFSLVITGILNIIAGFLNPGKKAEAHLNFNASYSQLAVEITSEMVKPQSYRTDADVFIQRIMDNYNSLNNRSPAS